MSSNADWDIDSYREEHESEEHWSLRRKFMERWKDDYPVERLVCLARVFANIELLGCRYPTEVMQEVARLSTDVANAYRNSRKDKLKRTFVSASDAAEDRAKGIKREGGVIVDGPPAKSGKIEFVRQGHSNSQNDNDNHSPPNTEPLSLQSNDNDNTSTERVVKIDTEYIKEMSELRCLDVRGFSERMFHTSFGRLVLLIRPWSSRICNIQSSCQVCNVQLTQTFDSGIYSIMLNGKLLVQAKGSSKLEAKSVAESLAWDRLKQETVSVLMKEQFIAQGDARISMSDVTGKREEFGTPVEISVAAKMMKLMGWKGGGLGADAQGIAEPIQPHLQMVNRAGLGSQPSDIKHLRRSAQALMHRYIASDTLDVDLVFSSEFSKEERAALHQCAQKIGLSSKSYGDTDRFLVVKKKLDPFSLVRAVIEKGGCTPKYQVFIPTSLNQNANRRGRY